MKNCSVVIPAFNSQDTLQSLIERLGVVLATISQDYEVVIVNDCSSDHTWDITKCLAAQHSWVRGINLMRNYGQHNATLCGILKAKHSIIITMDDDLQHPPEEIPKLLKKLEEGYDVVYGIPDQNPHNWWRNFFSRFTKRILAFVMGIRTPFEIGSYRAFKGDLRKAFKDFDKPDVIVDVLLSWGTRNFGFIKVRENPREIGSSNYSFRKLFHLFMAVLTGFSTAPLRFTSVLGFIFVLFGIGLFIYVIIIYFTIGSILGFPFLASMIALFSGAQLFVLGIFGEYQARIFERTSQSPCFTIRDTTDGEE